MNYLKAARILSTTIVSGIAAWSSYFHMVTVARHFGERPEVAYVLPFSVDGMLIVASGAMVDDRANGRKIRPVAKVAFVIGVAASIGANVTAALPSLGARLVAAWPALALLLVVEMLSHRGKPEAAEVPPEVPVEVLVEVPPAPVAEVPPKVAPAVKPPRKREPSVRPAAKKGRPAHETAALARQILQDQPKITKKEVAAQLGVGERRLRQVLAAA